MGILADGLSREYSPKCCSDSRRREADSHKGIGWEQFTDSVIKCFTQKEHLIFMLWVQKQGTKGDL